MRTGTLNRTRSLPGPSGELSYGKDHMRDAKTFRRYAEECRRLALTLPQHKETLLRMADAWLACAEEEEKNRDDDDDGGAKS